VLLESEVPLRTPEEDGDLHKVELALEKTPDGYEPVNPLVELRLPDSADEPIEIGEEGLALTPLGASNAPASELGNGDLVLPGAHEDTSFLLSPIAGGLELSAMLASRNSPEQLAFDVDLPGGTTLRGDGAGGAEVVDAGGEASASITAPFAIDSQGTEVPASLAVEGGKLVISVEHRGLDVAYPLFVDPEFIEENWSGFADTSKLGYWHWAWSGVAGAEDYIGRTSCIVTCWGNGLYVRSRSSFGYPAGSWGRWWFVPQGSTTYMRRVVLGPINYDAHGCSANEPHPYVGVLNNSGAWVVRNNAYPSGWATNIDAPNLPVGSRTAFVGIHAESGANISCGHDYRLGGATLFLDDPEKPTVGAPSGYPTGWVKSGQSFTISAPASDPGLGVYAATLYPAQTVTQEKKQGCNGHYSSACPASYAFQFPMSAGSFDEGEKSVEFKATDALEKPSNSYVWMMKVDRGPPEIELAGQLAQATDETEGDAKDDKDKPLPLPVYNLTINATDGRVGTAGNPIQPAEKRSGVKKIQVFLDGNSTPLQTWEASSCSAGNCPLSKVFTLKLNELSADTDHYLRILATDFAGNAPRERKVEFEYIPATGMKDEYLMQHFPLPDGSGDEAEEEHPRRPELAVNLVNGNLVYRQKDVDVEGTGADLELELFYNSLLPGSKNSEWGDGWTLAQTPELELESPAAPGPATEATIVEESGGVESKVDLPVNTGEEDFDKRLQATVTKEPGGGYELSDESGESDSAIAFDPSGRAEELRTGSDATVEYDYEAGALSEISVEDPGTANVPPGSLDEDKPYPDLAISHAANFGTYGSSDGQTKSPSDVLLDDQGNLWVLDRINDRIQKLGPNGQFIGKFGASGSGEGQLSNPTAFAMDTAGNCLVVDANRVKKFSPGGQFISQFGAYGAAPGQFETAGGITVGHDGTIWVSDLFHVQRFTAGGQFIERADTSKVFFPQSLDTAPNGDVLVADYGRIEVLSEEGDFLRAFGTAGTGPGQLGEPTEVDVDRDGNVWVGDAQTDRVQLYNAAGDYVEQFGSFGTGAQQFKLDESSGIVADGQGSVWVADPGNNRVARWVASPITGFFHSANFGSSGSVDGQMKSPSDALLDDQGDLWVLDRNNARIQRFGPDGQFIAKFGTPGTGEGQLSNPRAFALDAAGNLLVVDNNRVKKFSPSGQFLSQFGSYGAAAGQFEGAGGIAVGRDGTIWVADMLRVQRFTAGGQFVERVGASQIFFPLGLDTAPNGNVLVADSASARIEVLSEEGDYLRSFGSAGSGPGQFSEPIEVDVDPSGNVWVGDGQTDRIQLYNAAGDYVAQFGSFGTGAQQLKLGAPAGIAADGEGRVWVADSGNNRVAEWVGGNYTPSSEPVLTEDDPQLDVNVSEGLVESVEGDEAGTVTYGHSGDLLTEVSGPESEADFSYDGTGKMTKVTLPNGTYAEVAYEPSYGRVKSVTVAPSGANPKTTSFSWSDEPRRTTVIPPGSPTTTYDIAADGSIFKWWNAKQPPTLDDISGTLYDPANRETATPIPIGVHNLVVQAHDDEGVAEIRVIANNDELVDERSCPEIETEPSKCATFSNEWVTETANWPPGIVYLEVIATDRLGESTSQRFWVNIPYTPPPDPEAEEPPRFSDVLRFREEFGLDLDLAGDESALYDRIFESIGAWNNPSTPAGEVAQASAAKWGVPLRPQDVAEMEYREWYVDHDGPLIEEWGYSQYPETYAGYEVDHADGGIIHVGFTSAQEQRVVDLVAAGGLVAPDRVEPAIAVPAHARLALEGLEDAVANAADTDSILAPLVNDVTISGSGDTIVVSATDVPTAELRLTELFGASSAMDVLSRPEAAQFQSSRYRQGGRMLAGEWVYTDWTPEALPTWTRGTAGFGAVEKEYVEQENRWLKTRFLLTAGHMGTTGALMYRVSNPNLGAKELREKGEKIGRIGRDALWEGSGAIDALATRFNSAGLAPRSIFGHDGRRPPIGPAGVARIGQVLCVSGAHTNRVRCGEVTGFNHAEYEGHSKSVGVVSVYGLGTEPGDSGAPIWNPRTHQSVGLLSGSPREGNRKRRFVQPLLNTPIGHGHHIVGALNATVMGDLHIISDP
jgi:streptogramin lyase